MKERPILFSGPMVRALLAGTKTQTRRIVKAKPGGSFQVYYRPFDNSREVQGLTAGGTLGDVIKCPYGQPGERLWVRETHHKYGSGWIYRADYGEHTPVSDGIGGPWKPSIHMPRVASRILLEIVSVRVERLQDISLKDVRAEGCEVREFSLLFTEDAAERQQVGASVYRTLWESINGPSSWQANPWVWVVEFKRIDS
ncbi:hypothetical protein H4317_11060 [Hymenobacter sediminicola]|uniref:ASCH domain-containing protein n=1 Tax=Hymenobacter sediminicola TaxID=2761579 RepID=A0A7G7WCP8_9BACT|nr:hypothetical protein H4317_11060 [Hymenobacter sediminicola]